MVDKIVDVHVHPFELMTDDDLLTELDKAGVDVAVLLALDVDPQDLDRPEIKKMLSGRLLDMLFWNAKEVIEQPKVILEVARADNELVAGLNTSLSMRARKSNRESGHVSEYYTWGPSRA